MIWRLFFVIAAMAPVSVTAQDVVVTRDGDEWTADYTFDEDARAWAFVRSALTRIDQRPWRQGSWFVETPGVRLARIMDADGRLGHDVLLAEGDAVPRQVRIRFRAVTDDLAADYDPAMRFADGTTALYTGHFTVVPWSLAGDIDWSNGDGHSVTLQDTGGTVQAFGEVYETVAIAGEPTYVLFGSASPLRTEDLIAYVDTGLPEWIRGQLMRAIPNLMENYGKRLGSRKAANAPVLIVSWGGATTNRTSLGGSVLDGMVVMALEGDGLATENTDALADARWFIAHEAAHFWLGETVGYASRADVWITEGGADLLAVRVTADAVPGFDARAKLQDAIVECAAYLPNGPVATAFKRQEHRTNYACGAIFGMVAEAVAARKGGNFFTFLNGLIARERAGDGAIDTNEWLDHLRATGGEPRLVAQIATMHESGSSEPHAALSALLDAAGVAFVPDNSGLPILE